MNGNLCLSPLVRVMLVCLAVVILSASGFATVPASWHGLESGRYGIGFATIEKFDYSRSYSAETDYFGNKNEGETARPIQICYWYPAVADPDQSGMNFGQYAYPYPEDSRFISLLSALQNREIGTIRMFVRGDQGLSLDAMNTELAAIRDAAWADGKFPLVLLHTDLNSTIGQLVVMSEYLASHGFVVATTHVIGTRSTNAGATARDIETITRDKEFALAQLRQLPKVDYARVGLVSVGFGSLSAFTQAMRATDIDALVTLEGTFMLPNRDQLVNDNDFYAPEGLTTPWMQMYSETRSAEEELIFSNLKYADRYAMKIVGSSIVDFVSYGFVVGGVMPDSAKPEYARHAAICQNVKMFLESELNDNAEARSYFENFASTEEIVFAQQSGAELPPSADDLISVVRRQGVATAVELDKKFKLFTPEQSLLSEAQLNGMGYQFLQRGRVEDALPFFEWATICFPTSCNVWDSHAEANAAAENYEVALTSYKKALEVVPNDMATNQATKDYILRNSPEAIARLEALIAERDGSGE